MDFQPIHAVLHQPSLIPLALVAGATAYIFYQCFLHPLSSVPGPFSASLSRLWLIKHAWDGDLHTLMIDLHARHGKLVRTGPNEVSVADVAGIKTIYGAGTKFRKSEWYSVWQGHRKFDLFPERDEKLHGKQRSLVSRAYAMDSLKDLEPYVEDVIEVLLGRLKGMVGEVVDLGEWVQMFAFDVIGEVTFSKRFGFLDAGTDEGQTAVIDHASRCAAWVGQIPWLYWLHDALSPYIGNHLAITARHGSIRQFAVNQVSAYQDRGSDRKDVLSKLMAMHKEKPNELDNNAVNSMATSNIFAGSDTTATAARAILWNILKHPDCKQRLLKEIDDARKAGKLSDPVKLSEADRMPYFQAVIYEGMRLHPSVGMNLVRVVPEGGAAIADTFMPAGTMVGANPFAIHRMSEVFGDDVEAFKPERWLKDDVGDMKRMFFNFGAGARSCIGRNISWMEISKLVPTLFMRLDMELSEPEKPMTAKAWWLCKQKGLNVRILRDKTL